MSKMKEILESQPKKNAPLEANTPHVIKLYKAALRIMKVLSTGKVDPEEILDRLDPQTRKSMEDFTERK